MKSTTFVVLILLSTFISYLPSTTAEHVLDSDGEPIQNGGTYYLLPPLWPGPGGIERVATGKETCPLTVVQSRLGKRGLPIRVSSPQRSLFISLGSNVRVGFASPPKCAPSPWWTIVEGLPEGSAVKLSGYKSTVDGSFKIEKVPSIFNTYKLLFCEHGKRSCGDIGTYVDEEGNLRLVVTENNPMVFGFNRAFDGIEKSHAFSIV